MSESGLAIIQQSLAELGRQIGQLPGDKIRSLQPADSGPVADLVRGVLKKLAEGLLWLHQAALQAQGYLDQADPALALLESLAETLKALGDELSTLDGQQLGPVDLSPVAAAGGGLSTAGGALSQLGLAGKVLPTPQELSGLRQELVILLGKKADPKAPAGLLEALNQQINP